MEFFDILKAGEMVIGMVIALFSGLFGIMIWWDRRSRTYTDARAKAVEQTNRKVFDRLNSVESDLKRVDRDLTSLKGQISALPTQRDFSGLSSTVSGLEATVRQMNGMLNTLYEAAVRASEKAP